ncbi:MAG: hypothetical protein NTW68_00830 [candidate division NC10 bacterium]|nr:hypothetical protein [candidate division NC10 bacterium]
MFAKRPVERLSPTDRLSVVGCQFLINQFGIQLLDPRNQPGHIVAVERHASAGRRQASPQVRLRQQAPDRHRHGGGITRRDEPPRLAMRHQVRHAPYLGRQNRNTGRHGLDQGHGSPLVS